MSRIIADGLSPRGMGTTADKAMAGDDPRIAQAFKQVQADSFGSGAGLALAELRDGLATEFGSMQSQTYTDFVPGTTTTLTLLGPQDAASILVFFDGLYVNTDQWTWASGTLTFSSPIPIGVAAVEVRWMPHTGVQTLWAADQLAAQFSAIADPQLPLPVFDQLFGYGATLLDPRITFTRPGDRYEIIDGQLKEFGVNEPCLTGDGWSVRPAETNLWWPTDGSSHVSLVNITRTDEDTYPGPDEDGKPSPLFQAQTGGAGSDGNRYFGLGGYPATINRKTLSVIVRAKTASRFALRIQQPYPWRTDALFDLATGALVDQYTSGFTNVATVSTPLADGWWRFDLTGTRVDSATFSAFLGPTERLVASTFEADDGTTPSAYVYAVWVNEGDPIPYIPTTDSAVTRAADSALIQGDAFASVFNPVEGAVVFDYADLYATALAARTFSLAGASGALLYIYHTNTTIGAAVFNDAGATLFNSALTSNTRDLKIALAWTNGKVDAAVGGNIYPLVAAGMGMQSINKLFIDPNSGANKIAAVTARRLTIFNRRPSDAQMEALTS